MASLVSRLKRAWFLIALAVVLAGGMLASNQLAAAADNFPRTALIAAILFITSLPIDFAKATGVRGAWAAVGLAVLFNAVAAPLLGGLACLAIPARFAAGMVVATASPCTIASAAVWTRRGGGNDAVAVLVTLITSLGCFLVLPAAANVFLGATLEGGVPNLLPKLLVCVVAPLVLAQLLRRLPGVGAWSAGQKPLLSLIAQLGVLTMAGLGAIKAGQALANSGADAVGLTDWLLVFAATAGVHTALLLAGWSAARGLGVGTPEATAVAIAGSQKTLAVGVGIALEFGGLAVFPMVAYHVQQLLIDTLFADWRRAKAEETPPG